MSQMQYSLKAKIRHSCLTWHSMSSRISSKWSRKNWTSRCMRFTIGTRRILQDWYMNSWRTTFQNSNLSTTKMMTVIPYVTYQMLQRSSPINFTSKGLYGSGNSQNSTGASTSSGRVTRRSLLKILAIRQARAMSKKIGLTRTSTSSTASPR